MKKFLFLLAFIIGSSANSSFAEGWTPSRTLLQAVRSVESSNGRFVYGDNGKSLGAFQISQAAWADVNEYRKGKRLKTYEYQQHVYNAYINQVYAADYLTLLHGHLTHELKKEPSPQQLYAAYNMGLSNFADCHYDLRRVNKITAERCQAIGLIVKAN
ncbi:MAG: hypothetical protein JWN25_1623 [Verrucomicrobiales bacterium]|jgi:hypothetical protein|nr:hypothetical protein [Verrucomicrobiales bacterium]